MDFKWLEDFLSLCDTHSFSRAADQRGMLDLAASREFQRCADQGDRQN